MTAYSSDEPDAHAGFDPIDVQFDRSGATARRLSLAPQQRSLDWSAAPFGALIVLIAGAGLGPQGLALLTPKILAFLDPAAPVALATLGALASLGVGSAREVASGASQAVLTAVAVSAGLLIAEPAVMPGAAVAPWRMTALVLSIAAATSSSLPSRRDASTDGLARLHVHDCLVPIILGGVLLAFARESSPPAALWFAVQSAGIAIVIAIAGQLLAARATTTSEQRLFVLASLLLLGGAADFLSSSGLFMGLIAGVVWKSMGGAAREPIHRDARYVQHSLLMLVLLLAGASADFSPGALMLSIPYVVCRTAGKLAGGWTAARWLPAVPRGASFSLIAPGAFGVAFALNVVRADGAQFAPALTIVVVGTIASSLVAAVTCREGGER